MILLLDNYDSFTYNLYQLLCMQGVEVVIKKNDELELSEVMDFERVVISPGPGRPEDAGVSCDLIKEFAGKLPILGVCLGHQAIGQVFGVSVVNAKEIVHGKTSLISHKRDGLFNGVKEDLKVARYHSLALGEVPSGFELSAWAEDGEIMGIENDELGIFGVQFHPESFMSEEGEKIINNFLNV